MPRTRAHPAYTLLEVALVMALLIVLVGVAVPNLVRDIQSETLPRSARQFRSLLNLVGAHAALEGKRYRVRFALSDEDDENILMDRFQPIIEREEDPIRNPEVFTVVRAPWVIGRTFLEGVWCARVRIGRPTIAMLQEERDGTSMREEREIKEEFEDFDVERPPVVFEPDGTTAWVTFVLTSAPPDIGIDELEDHARIDVILEGATGMAWLQRPFYDQELDLFEDHGWPAVLRQDFLSSRELTEDDVLEIRETNLRGYDVELTGQNLEPVQGDGAGTAP